MKLDGTYSRQGGQQVVLDGSETNPRQLDRPAPAYTLLLGYAFSDTLTRTPCV